MSLTVANLVDRAAAKFGDKPFIFFDSPMQYKNLGPGPQATSASFTEALEFTNAIAAVMRDELGVKPGDRIAVALTNVPELGLIFTAAARIGAIMVPFNYMLKAEELTPVKTSLQRAIDWFRQEGYIPRSDAWVAFTRTLQKICNIGMS